MKTMYICDKCGKEFESWDECYACENSHITSFSYLLDEEVQKRLRYNPGCPAPTELIMPEQKDVYNEATQQYDTTFTFWTHKLVGRVSKKEADAINAEYQERKVKEDAYWAEYRAKREAEKAAKEQETA